MTEHLTWGDAKSQSAARFICGHCGADVASERGWKASIPNSTAFRTIYICPSCTCPTFFKNNGQIPGVAHGSAVNDVPDELVIGLYNEARRCTSANAYTAAVLCCRKILMNIAVSKGASEGKPFVCYIDHLAEQGYIPPDGRDWVDHIRQKGNEANHVIAPISVDDAEELLSFIEMLLKFIFEFPARMNRKISGSGS